MTTKKSNHIRTFLFACIALLFIITAGCQQHPARPPLSATDVKTLSTEFDGISNAHLAAWNNHDFTSMDQVYADDIKYYEKTGNAPDYQGSAEVIALMNGVDQDTNIGGLSGGTFIGRETGFDIWEEWGYDEELGFSKDNLLYEYNFYTLRGGKIAEWWLDYGMDYLAVKGVQISEKPLQEYAAAWSSGNPKTVASLYDPQAVRTDTLYGENEQGSTAIKEFAGSFFAWYPGVLLELQKSFAYNPLEIGGVYAIHVSDQAGKPCDVRAIILLDLEKNKTTNKFDVITNERVFYQPDTLLACGWAR
jgi:hypothetical protein